MPIYQHNDALILHFGYGDIAVNLGRNVEKPFEDELIFFETAPNPIGAQTDEFKGKSTDDLKAPLRFIFDNPNSINVLIERLEALRDAHLPVAS